MSRSSASYITRLPPLSASEQALWELSSQDQHARLPRRSGLRTSCTQDRSKRRRRRSTRKSPRSPTAPSPPFHKWPACFRGCENRAAIMDNLGRKTIEKQLQADDLSLQVRRALELRLGGAQAAVKKIDALLLRAGDDDRVRGSFRYHGAATGRWSGEGLQPQNLKRVAVERSRCRSRCGRDRRLSAREGLISQTPRCCWRLQPRNDQCCSGAHADRRGLQRN